MKTLISTLSVLIALTFSNGHSARAATVKTNEATVVAEAAKFNKIEVRGNVTLYVSYGSADQVKVYNKYYSESALVQNQNGVLRISSYNKEKLIVWVTAADLRNLSAYDNAEVKSFGKLSAINLDINLYDNAAAQLDVDVYQASINVNSHAKIDLKGDINECWLKHDRSATVNSVALAAQHLVINNVPFAEAKIEQVAVI